ncbi:MAG: PQQ-binding-like beta-propeller repeat protein [Pirellulales bacterium]|nr:PQQ-binding-like beta-propeller repeat protein [Pirellulales bacterium]
MFSRRNLLLIGTPAMALGCVTGYVLLSGRQPEEEHSDNALEPEERIAVDATPAPDASEIAYVATATLPPFDWPWLFGPDGTSIINYPAELAAWPAAGPPILWRKPIGQGYSAPVIQDGKLIAFHRQGNEERIECLDAQSGERLWEFAYATAYKSPVRYSDGPYSTPAIVGDRLFAIGAEAKLHCLNLAEGEPVWSRDLKAEFSLVDTNYGRQEFYGFCPSPLPLGNTLVINVGGQESKAGIVAFDQSNGETLWQATTDGASYATPVAAKIDGALAAVVLTRDALVVLGAKDGNVLFREEFHSKNPDTTNATSPVVSDEMIFVSGYGVGSMAVTVPGLELLDPAHEQSASSQSTSSGPCQPTVAVTDLEPTVLWRKHRGLDAQYTNLFKLDGVVIGYPSRLKGTLMTTDLASGKTHWKLATGYARGSGLFINGELIVLNEDGVLLRFDKLPEKPVLTSVIEGYLKGPCYTGPTFANGRMYLRTEEELVCVRLF